MPSSRFFRGYDKFKQRYRNFKSYEIKRCAVDNNDSYRERMQATVAGPFELFVKRLWVNRGLVTLVNRSGDKVNYPVSLLRDHEWFRDDIGAMFNMFIPQSRALLKSCWELTEWEIDQVIEGRKRLQDI